MSLAQEKHYRPEEIAELWGLHVDSIRRRFENEPGVLILEEQKKGKRRYRTMRIPHSVLERVHRSRQVA